MAPSLFHVKEHVVEGQHVRDYPHATACSQDEPLLLAVKQYVPRDNPEPKPGGVTIIGAHANGFPKEMYEPLWEDLVTALAKRGVAVRGIWVADVAWQGHSGRLNRDRLGNDPSWFDHSRDLLHVVNVFRASMPRPLVGVGHSFGGCALLHLSLGLHPRLLSSLVLLDPVLEPDGVCGPDHRATVVAALSARRRDRWPSHAAAEAAFRRSPSHAAWDGRVLEAWVRYGVCPAAGSGGAKDGRGQGDDSTAGSSNAEAERHPTQNQGQRNQHQQEEEEEDEEGSRPVELTTTKHQEIFTFLRPIAQEVNSLVPPTRGGNGNSQPPVVANVKTERRPNRALVPDAQPEELAQCWPTGLRFYRPEPQLTFARLPALRPGALFLFGGTSDFLSPALRERITSMVVDTGVDGSGRLAQVVVPGHGHLVPFEAPTTCAGHAADFVASDLKFWRAEEDEFRAWARRPLGERQALDEDWVRWLAPSRKKETKL